MAQSGHATPRSPTPQPATNGCAPSLCRALACPSYGGSLAWIVGPAHTGNHLCCTATSVARIPPPRRLPGVLVCGCLRAAQHVTARRLAASAQGMKIDAMLRDQPVQTRKEVIGRNSPVGVGIVVKKSKQEELDNGLTILAVVPGGAASESGQVSAGLQVRRRAGHVCGVCRCRPHCALQRVSVCPSEDDSASQRFVTAAAPAVVPWSWRS